MLSAEDNPGIFSFLVGMIVLVMAGVGLSILVDQRFKFSSSMGDIQRDIASAEEELGMLKSHHEQRSRLFESSGSQVKSDWAANAELRLNATALAKRQSELERSREALLTAIPSIETEFSRYRAEYRQQTRTSAIGQKVGTLTMRGGRKYDEVVITRVTDVGIEIRHRDGIARIQAPDLDHSWQDHYQWSDEERRNRLKEELANHESIAPPPAPREVEELPPPTRLRPSADNKEDGKLQELRMKVSGWRGKVSRLKSERSEAASQSYTSQPSVTGSLETWKAKTARLNAEIAKAQGELVVAKSRLAAVSPNDVLLRMPESGSDPDSGY